MLGSADEQNVRPYGMVARCDLIPKQYVTPRTPDIPDNRAYGKIALTVYC
jgi:hypothetical protein